MVTKLVKRIDRYIIKKYLGTFFLAIALIISISIIFDISENIDDFITKKAPLHAIAFDYYLNFIPYFANLFSALFTFIAVIFFTSKMAYNSEIIAILASGVSYHRLMRPYMIASAVIAGMSWILGNFIIPVSTEARVNFRNTYIKNEYINSDKNIHRQLEPGLFVYMQSYNNKLDVGYRFSIDKFEGKKLVSKLIAESIKWDRDKKKWVIQNYYIRDTHGPEEIIKTGTAIDTTLRMSPADFGQQNSKEETMDYWQINDYIKDLKLRGVDNVARYEQEKYRRTAGPISTFILSVIGVSLASRRMRGGMGLHLGLGLLLSFSYIMFMQISTIFALKVGFNTLLAVWLPNIIYSLIAVGLYRWASK
ncbi:MAG TPA: LptF/LptG family permease [Prolixibacteraceae bacterium]|jgi:lipopolysaccharide export system permease protein